MSPRSVGKEVWLQRGKLFATEYPWGAVLKARDIGVKKLEREDRLQKALPLFGIPPSASDLTSARR